MPLVRHTAGKGKAALILHSHLRALVARPQGQLARREEGWVERSKAESTNSILEKVNEREADDRTSAENRARPGGFFSTQLARQSTSEKNTHQAVHLCRAPLSGRSEHWTTAGPFHFPLPCPFKCTDGVVRQIAEEAEDRHVPPQRKSCPSFVQSRTIPTRDASMSCIVY